MVSQSKNKSKCYPPFIWLDLDFNSKFEKKNYHQPKYLISKLRKSHFLGMHIVSTSYSLLFLHFVLTHWNLFFQEIFTLIFTYCTISLKLVLSGNLHFNATVPEFTMEAKQLIEPFIYEWTQKHRGSISAEHGLGFLKKDYIHYSKSPAAVNLMQQIKQVFDPKGILNPYKTLPAPKSTSW